MEYGVACREAVFPYRQELEQYGKGMEQGHIITQ